MVELFAAALAKAEQASSGGRSNVHSLERLEGEK
jgi:hypothetical protein